MDVPRAVREDPRRADADDELRPLVLGQERVVLVDRGDAVQPHPLLPLEVDEQQAHLRVRQQVPHREEHAVAVVAGERDRVLVEHLDEARIAALVRALRRPVLVRGREEEHVARLDERAVVGVDRVSGRRAPRAGRRGGACRSGPGGRGCRRDRCSRRDDARGEEPKSMLPRSATRSRRAPRGTTIPRSAGRPPPRRRILDSASPSGLRTASARTRSPRGSTRRPTAPRPSSFRAASTTSRRGGPSTTRQPTCRR